ncbi:hypothetical protein BWI17_07980 [Betaproteobacteria bacterium GR16-43]|nr:hypothetical protein BWI17_07980 [Betaproteobacteria bacterium GR16-43]
MIVRAQKPASQCHAVIDEIHLRLEARGFRREKPRSDDSRFAWWSKPAFGDCIFLLEFLGSPPRGGEIEFLISLGVGSSRYTETENHVKVWECDPLWPQAPMEYPLDLVRVALHWLQLNADPTIPRQGWSASAESARACAAQVDRDFEVFGLPFLESVSTSAALIHLLQNIDAYPRKIAAQGPGSGEASLCAALLLHWDGQRDAAIRELDLGLREDIARYQRMFGHTPRCEEAIQVRRCKIERYRALFHSEPAR